MAEHPFKLTFNAHPGYLHVLVEGAMDSLAISNMICAEVSSVCWARRCRKLLYEEDLGSQLSQEEMVQFATAAGYFGLEGMQIAVVDRRNGDFEGNQLGVEIARTRQVNVRLFRTVAAAEAWLTA